MTDKKRDRDRETQREQLQLRVTLLHRNNEIILPLVYTANKINLKTITMEATAFAFLHNYFSDKMWPFRIHVTDGRFGCRPTVCSEKTICAPPLHALRSFPSVAFETVAMFV